MARRQRKSRDGGAGAEDLGPRRRCIVTGAVRGKDEMLRFVIGTEGEVVPDLNCRLPGRGLWLSAGRDMIRTAGVKNLFAKAARTKVVMPDDLADRVERLLARRCFDLIGLACRAGQAVAGYEKARAWLRAGRAGVLLEASDGASASRAKMQALAPGVPLVEVFSGDELGAALGRQHAVHLVLAPGRLADGLLCDTSRLASFRTVEGTSRSQAENLK